MRSVNNFRSFLGQNYQILRTKNHDPKLSFVKWTGFLNLVFKQLTTPFKTFCETRHHRRVSSLVLFTSNSFLQLYLVSFFKSCTILTFGVCGLHNRQSKVLTLFSEGNSKYLCLWILLKGDINSAKKSMKHTRR